MNPIARGHKWEKGRQMSENTANKLRQVGRNVGNTMCTSVRVACRPQLSFLYLCIHYVVRPYKIAITCQILTNFPNFSLVKEQEISNKNRSVLSTTP